MKQTRVASLVAVAIAVGVVLWVVVTAAYAVLPELPWTAPITLVVVAVVELLLARAVRARIDRRPGAPMLSPLVIARYVVLAKASAYAAAVVAGAFGGVLAYLVANLNGPSQRADAWVAGGSTLAACGLAAAALLLEYACRVPPSDDEPSAPAPPPDREHHP